MSEPVKPVTSVEDLVNILVNWHSNVNAQLTHLAESPADVGLEVTDQDSGEVKLLTGVEREAFIQGLLVAKTTFATLPFTLQEKSDEA